MKQTALALAFSILAMPVLAANDVWDEIKSELYGERVLQDGSPYISIDAPYRTPDDARAELAAHIVAPPG